MDSTKSKNIKIKFSSELSYVLGLALLSFAAALIEGAGFGVSMVVAPAYILHLKISEFLPFFSFGMAEYTMQAILLITMMLTVRRFRFSYLLSFVTAVIYGVLLDLSINALSAIPDSLPMSIFLFVTGELLCAIGIALLFNTYISPEVYELFVKEVTDRFGFDLSITKTVYDCASLALSVIFSFVFFGFGSFVGIGIGTVICAFVNGPLIGFFSRVLRKRLEFTDSLPWREFFEQKKKHFTQI